MKTPRWTKSIMKNKMTTFKTEKKGFLLFFMQTMRYSSAIKYYYLLHCSFSYLSQDF